MVAMADLVAAKAAGLLGRAVAMAAAAMVEEAREAAGMGEAVRAGEGAEPCSEGMAEVSVAAEVVAKEAGETAVAMVEAGTAVEVRVPDQEGEVVVTEVEMAAAVREVGEHTELSRLQRGDCAPCTQR